MCRWIFYCNNNPFLFLFHYPLSVCKKYMRLYDTYNQLGPHISQDWLHLFVGLSKGTSLSNLDLITSSTKGIFVSQMVRKITIKSKFMSNKVTRSFALMCPH